MIPASSQRTGTFIDDLGVGGGVKFPPPYPGSFNSSGVAPVGSRPAFSEPPPGVPVGGVFGSATTASGINPLNTILPTRKSPSAVNPELLNRFRQFQAMQQILPAYQNGLGNQLPALLRWAMLRGGNPLQNSIHPPPGIPGGTPGPTGGPAGVGPNLRWPPPPIGPT